MHPASPQLIDFVEDRLGAEQRRGVLEHLRRSCARCEQRIDLYRVLVGALRRGPLPSAPRPLVDAAIGLFRLHRDARERSRRTPASVDAAPDELLGTLVYDSWNAAAAGLRGASERRRLRFEGGGLELDLSLERRADGWHILGQALRVTDVPVPLAQAHWQLVADGHTVGEGHCDEEGSFSARVLDPASLAVLLEPDGRAVRFLLPH